MVHITIDDQSYKVQEGLSVLQVLRENGIKIPTLCYHPALKPSGSCKLCAVEVPGRTSGRQITMLSCILKVREGLAVRTRGDLVNQARKKAFQNLLRMAPQAQAIRGKLEDFKSDSARSLTDPDGRRARLVEWYRRLTGA